VAARNPLRAPLTRTKTQIPDVKDLARTTKTPPVGLRDIDPKKRLDGAALQRCDKP
jgi:hypothetical protein